MPRAVTGEMPVPPAASLRLLVIVTMLAAVACGRRTLPKPPELVAPQAIADLRADNHTDGVVLQWSRPIKHADGSALTDLGGFIVERASADGSTDFQPLSTIDLADHERFRQTKTFRFLDREPQVGSRVRYRVTAKTDDDYLSTPSNVVVLTRELPPAPIPTAHGRGNSTP